MRTATVSRATKETDIRLTLTLLPAGQTGKFSGSSGIGFLDHMLTALCLHGDMNLDLTMTGDLAVDGHHSVEDLGIALGDALRNALQSDTTPVCRYGTAFVPMDESLARAVLDLSGRPYLVFDAAFDHRLVGTLETDLVREFFYAFAVHSGTTLHLTLLAGGNDHHKIEALFKAFARALSQAFQPKAGDLLSTKGVL